MLKPSNFATTDLTITRWELLTIDNKACKVCGDRGEYLTIVDDIVCSRCVKWWKILRIEMKLMKVSKKTPIHLKELY